MKEDKETLKTGEEILEIRIPDEDVKNWVETLERGGFTKEEINRIMSGLNKRYRKEHNPNIVEEEIENLKIIFRKKHNRELTPEEIKEWRKSLEILEGDDEDDD
ncbi:MAG: hypothetical protein NT058_00760 [Candidatus Portnoybacteria bacterium]|nr:hypothetical protein [Candidatus Portnoybacteria bacterium]